MQPFTLRYLNTKECKIQCGKIIELCSKSCSTFCYLLEGRVQLSQHSEHKILDYEIQCGELFYIYPSQNYIVNNIREDTAHLINIHFDVTEGADSFTTLITRDESSYPIYKLRLPQMITWYYEFLSYKGNHDAALHYRIQSHLYAITSAFISSGYATMENCLNAYITETKHYIEEHFRTEIDIGEIIKRSGVAPNRFYQAFKLALGLTPQRYITEIRLNESRHLLRNTSLTIKEIAHSVGYKDEYYFSRIFKRHIGISPSEYVISNQVKNNDVT